MADRDITIPTGPDTTQGHAPLTPDMLEVTVSDDAAEPASEISPEGAGMSQMDEMQQSFAALRDSIGQGRELKARERDREELGERIKADREELADREDILANYQALVAEQDAIIAQNTQQRDARKAELAQLSTELDEASDALDRMRAYHDGLLDPLETNLGRARATAEQAKNDERSRKSELNAAEKEVSRSEGGDTTVAAAKVKVFEDAYAEAQARSNAAKEALDEAQRAYDDARQEFEQAEAPLDRTVQDKAGKIDELKGSIERLGETISTARKRRQYCDSVYQYPEETAKLHAAVEADEAMARQMDAENDSLRTQLANSRKRAKTAKIAIGVIIALIVIIVVAFIFVNVRA